MHRYFIKTPWIVKKFFSGYTWSLPAQNKELYLTFDDGPHPRITTWVLDELAKYGAKATFFCIGENVLRYPDTYQRILAEGHTVGNHTQNHPNGWKVPTEQYIANVEEAAKYIDSPLFRPPYGRIKSAHLRYLNKIFNGKAQVIMWDVLSADFDVSFTPEQCLANVMNHTEEGSIIVFHDSEKAYRNMSFVLPKVLEHFSGEGYRFRRIEHSF